MSQCLKTIQNQISKPNIWDIKIGHIASVGIEKRNVSLIIDLNIESCHAGIENGAGQTVYCVCTHGWRMMVRDRPCIVYVLMDGGWCGDRPCIVYVLMDGEWCGDRPCIVYVGLLMDGGSDSR